LFEQPESKGIVAAHSPKSPSAPSKTVAELSGAAKP
jgi:hypothetical protein